VIIVHDNILSGSVMKSVSVHGTIQRANKVVVGITFWELTA
jgi:hypothetical protein